MARGHRVQRTEVAGIPACSLHDDSSDLHGIWVPGAGMLAASLVHRGEELLWQGAGADGYAHERKFMGIPFLYPWANRLSGFEYRCGGHTVALDRSSSLLKMDDNGLPIHGLLTADPRWSVEELTADGDGARLTASLQFDRPDLLAAFPFPHRIEIEVRLAGVEVQVKTTVIATGNEPLPVAFGFHPYLQIPRAPRADWEVSFPVRRHLLLDKLGIPTGASEEVSGLEGPIGDRTWDDAFDRIEPPGLFEVAAAGRTTSLHYGEGYPIAQIFAPPGQEYACVEPMTAPTNSLGGPDSAHPWVPAGERLSATFTIACAVA